MIDTYPAQREAALRAKTILTARNAGEIDNLSLLNDTLAALPEGDKGYLQQTKAVRKMVNDIAVQQNRLDMQSRLFVRREMALGLVGLIDSFTSKIAGYQEPLPTEFRKAAKEWKKKAHAQLDATEQALQKEPAIQVFQAGRPVDPGKEAFVPRYAVLDKLGEHATMSAGPRRGGPRVTRASPCRRWREGPRWWAGCCS